jgi:stage IV sporulation protein FB
VGTPLAGCHQFFSEGDPVFADNPTPFDLHFRLFGFPVRVSPWFWLIMALLGNWVFSHPDYGPPYLLLWMACGFVSILAHELGHAVLIRRFGSPSAIVLHGFGGYAEMPYPPTARWKRILIALAGPAAGIALLGVVVGSNLAGGWAERSPVLAAAFLFLVLMNLIWSLFNLLPIWPLDGGRVCREVLSVAGARRPDAAAFAVSLAVSGLLTLWGILVAAGQEPRWLADNVPYAPTLFMTLWFGLFAVQSYLLLQKANRQASWGRSYYDEDDDSSPWRRR